MNTRRTRGGFTLIEIMMAFSILLLGCVGVYAVFSVGLVSHKRAVDNTNAATLAGSLFSDIAANYHEYYYDRNHNGVPDKSEDGNNNGIPDWFEVQASGRLRDPIPMIQGYRYTIRYERSAAVDQELFVTIRVFWQAQGEDKGAAFQRSVFLKNLPTKEPQ